MLQPEYGTITVTKNGTIIYPYKRGQSRSLEKATGRYDAVYHSWVETTGFRIPNYRGSPAFITHNMVKSELRQFMDTYEYEVMPVTRALPIGQEFTLSPRITLREYQGDIAAEIITSANTTREWFVNLQTGFGKTMLGVYLASVFKKKTMIVCFLSEILKQWKESFSGNTNIDTSRILRIDSGKILDKIYHNDFDPDAYDIYLISPSLITNYINTRDASYITDIMNHLGIGFLIYDEGHHNMGLIIKLNALSNVKYTLYLSADFAQGDSRKEDQWLKIFRNAKVIRPDKKYEPDMKYTQVIIVDYDSHPTQLEHDSAFTKYGYSADFYMRYQMQKGRIKEVIAHLVQLIEKARKPDQKALILFTNIAAVDEMTEYLRDHIKSNSLIFGRYHSAMSDYERTETREFANVIISTYSSFGTGMDEDNIKYVIGTNQSNKVEDNQAAGRSRPLKDGSKSIYFIVTDTAFPYCRKKLKTRLAYLQTTKMSTTPTVYHM